MIVKTLKQKILLLILIPVFAMTWISGTLISNRISQLQSMQSLQKLTEVAVSFSNVLHETQKERGATAGFLGSAPSATSAPIPVQ